MIDYTEEDCKELLRDNCQKQDTLQSSGLIWLNKFNNAKSIANILGLSKPAPIVITVAGTNGKGSTVKFLQEIYTAAQYKVAAYYSPHVYQLNERIYCNNDYICYSDLYQTLETVIAQQNKQQPLAFFSVLTLAALYYFQKKKLDVVILEVGLGGRYDPVNIIDADIAVIAHIDLDHTQILGHSIETISYNKAGIMRSDKTVVISDAEVAQSLLEYAHKINAKPYIYKKNFDFFEESDSWTYKSDTNTYSKLPKPTLDIKNATSAIATTDHLQYCLPISETEIVSAMNVAYLPGRFETLYEKPLIIADMAHNPNAMCKFKNKLESMHIKGRAYAIFAMAEDKDCLACLDILSDCIDYFYLTEVPDNDRMLSLDKMHLYAQQANLSNYSALSIPDALKQFISGYKELDCCFVIGSCSLVHAVKRIIPLMIC